MVQEELKERYDLAYGRLVEMIEEPKKGAAGDYFTLAASFLVSIQELLEHVEEKFWTKWDLTRIQKYYDSLYRPILSEHYEASYMNPAYASSKLGLELGRKFSFVAAECMMAIPYAFEGRLEEITAMMELMLELYGIYNTYVDTEEEELLDKEIFEAIYWYVSDYCDVTVQNRIREQVDPSLDFATKIVMESDLTDLRYLYAYGEYIGDNELETAAFLQSLPKKEIQKMAKAYTEGYYKGFELTGKDISIKKFVNIRYSLGFERMIKEAVELFGKMGLSPVIFRGKCSAANRPAEEYSGYIACDYNKQFTADHRFDKALFFDGDFVERKLGVMKNAYETYKKEANLLGGPAVIEVFGEEGFTPKIKKENYQLSESQQKLWLSYQKNVMELSDAYIHRDQRSFTIIAFPIPEIGPDFPEIFKETILVNSLNQEDYQKAQQVMIDLFDRGAYALVKGEGKNQTDMRVELYPIKEGETRFENCLADVNIPLGEVFTSPVLNNTRGVIHVSKVFLYGTCYEDLTLTIEDGMVKNYSCKNFSNDEDGKKLIQENLLFHHPSLPLGEFAIGTNTRAYVMAKKYKISDRLPILIMEKTGPHFAIGDTCYSYEEELETFNPDGKKIVARENEISKKRKTDPGQAYFGCHTDITIPYNEIAKISVVMEDGSEEAIIEHGRFVLKGTEFLNEVLDEEADS